MMQGTPTFICLQTYGCSMTEVLGSSMYLPAYATDPPELLRGTMCRLGGGFLPPSGNSVREVGPRAPTPESTHRLRLDEHRTAQPLGHRPRDGTPFSEYKVKRWPERMK